MDNEMSPLGLLMAELLGIVVLGCTSGAAGLAVQYALGGDSVEAGFFTGIFVSGSGCFAWILLELHKEQTK